MNANVLVTLELKSQSMSCIVHSTVVVIKRTFG